MAALSTVRALAAVVAWACVAAAAAQVAPAAAPTSQPAVDREIQVAADAFTRDPKPPSWVRPLATPTVKPNGGSSFELNDSQWMVGAPTVGYSRRVIRVNDQTALTSLGRVSLVFIPAFQKLVLHTLAIHRDGVTLDRLPSAEVRFLQRETGLERNVYSGLVTASILVDDLRVGDELEVAQSIVGTNPVFGARFSATEGWSTPVAVGVRRIVVNAPAERRIAWRFHDEVAKDAPRPVERVDGGIRTLTFEAKDVSSPIPEASVPPGFSQFRWLQLSEYASWDEVASWAATLFDAPEGGKVANDPASDERARLVAQWSALPTPEARTVAALEFVQSQVRYFSVSLGTSSHRPAAPNVVLARRYGDCKDKSLLLVALLADLGIASRPALARIGYRGGFADWLPTPLAFDHVIVAVDVGGATWYLDPTRLGQHGRLATMGQVHDGADVLPATAGTAAPVRIDVPNRDALTLTLADETLVLKSLDGDGDFTYVETTHGVAAETVRVALGVVPKDKLKEFIGKEIEKRYPGATFAGDVSWNDDRDNNVLTMRYRVVLPKPAKRDGALWRIAYRPENLWRAFTLPAEGARGAPLAVRHPVNVTYRFALTLPDDVSATYSPQSTTVADGYLAGTSNLVYRGNHATLTASAKSLGDRIPAADVTTYRADLQKLQRAVGTSLVVRDTDIKKSGVLGIGTTDIGTNAKRREEERVERLTKSIDGGKLASRDLALARCQRGMALATLDRNDAALVDAKAIEVGDSGDSPGVLACRGALRLELDDYPGAIDDLTQAIVLGDATSSTYRRRGRAKFFAGRHAEAAQDFAQAKKVAAAGTEDAYSDLWQAIAWLRAGKPLPDDLATRAKVDPRGTWPRPALAMLAGALPPDELNAIVASKQGDEAAIDATEARFYLGEKQLAAGDTAGARASFNASRAAGLATFIEYRGSGIELRGLRP